jgi:type II secretory pathway predicted ATPase ExeA
MTLEEYFGLSQPTFPRVATPASLMRTPVTDQIIERFRFALVRDTIALLISESGGGKSTLLSLFAQSLDPANYQVLSTSLTTLSPFSFIAHLVTSLGLRGRRFKGETAAALLMHLRSLPKRTVVLVDEAHLLPDASLEDLRLLTTDNLDRKSPFALVLVGQPALRERLTEPLHEALWQRIAVRLRLRPLNESEVKAFIEHHLKAAGAKTTNIFDSDAIAAIFQHSRGIPRIVQNIAIDAMLAAMQAGKKTIDASTVQQVVVDMEGA